MIKIHEDAPVKSTKRKRVSKKLKSSWRKHVDITDVDNFLEEQRLEERLGDYTVLSNNELFTVDTKPAATTKLTSKQAMRLKLKNAPLKCLSLLQPLTKVPDPIAKRNRVRTKDERKNELIKKKEAADRSRGIFKKKDLQSARDIRLDRERRQVKETQFDFNRNVWDEDVNVKSLAPSIKAAAEIDTTVTEDSWIQGDVERHILYGPGKMAKDIPKSVHRRPYLLNPVAIPHPGMSYNPSFKDHQDLLQLIADKEVKIIKEEKHLKRVTQDMFRKVTPEQRDSNWLIEMSQGLKPDQTNADEPSGNPDDSEYKPINPPTKNKEKSTKQRRKQREQQQLREKRHLAKIEKKKVSDMYRLRYINKEIEKAKKKTLIQHEKREKKEEYKKFEAKRLGFNKFEEPDLEFNMTKDIAGNLRNLKKEGSLLSDRFKSMQKRNIIEPTVHKSRKRAKVKKFVKAGHQDDTWKRNLAKKLTT